jgi:tRNA nucleotidyltransferase (CCA-adding enzyme)
VAESDCRGRTGDFDCSGIRWFLARARELGVEHDAPPPLVRGRHLLELGEPPGPRMGAILAQVYERQLDGRVTSLEDGLEAARQIRSQLEAMPSAPAD